jgi:hypothetical protein
MIQKEWKIKDVKQKYFKETWTKGRGHSWSNDGKSYFNNESYDESYNRVTKDRNPN